jgi:hypothetical protein
MNSKLVRMSLVGLAVLCAVLVVLAASAQAPQKQILQRGTPPVLCSDFVTTLTIVKNADGTADVSAHICNDGPGGYSNTTGNLDAYFMVYTWHPPKSPAQEANLKFYQHTDFGTAMKAKDCRVIRFKLTFEDFSRWGSFPASATERPAMKQVCGKIEKKGISFSKCEDTNMDNTVACQDIPYMEKIK